MYLILEACGVLSSLYKPRNYKLNLGGLEEQLLSNLILMALYYSFVVQSEFCGHIPNSDKFAVLLVSVCGIYTIVNIQLMHKFGV